MVNAISSLVWFFLLATAALAQKNDFNVVYQQFDWAPDSKSIAFTVIKVKPDWSDYSPDKWGLFILKLETRKLQKVDVGSLYFSFSKEGKLAYDKNFEGKRQMMLFDTENLKSNPIVQSEFKDSSPSWSPDSKRIAFYSNREGPEEIYALTLATREITKLTNSDGHKCYNPVWAPNSDLIVYYLEKGDNKDQIYLTDGTGSFHKNITNDDHHNIFPSWTPGGRIIYIRDLGEVMIMDSDGKNKEELLETSGGLVRMDPTGKHILSTDKEKNIILIDLKSRASEVILKAEEIFN